MIPPELQRLLQACKDEPDEDAPRLVLSDWLEEHDQADRAEFVRLQVRLARQELPAGEEAVAEARVHALYLRHAGEWLGDLRAWPGQCAFRRGLIEVQAGLPALRDRPPLAVAPHVVPWLETLVLRYGRQTNIGELLELDALAHFSGLYLTDTRLTSPWLDRLAGSPRVAHLRRLRVGISGSPKAAGEALARSPHLSGLRALDVPDGMGDACLAALVGAPVFRSLSTLALRYVAVRKGATGLANVVPAPRLSRLHWLYVRAGAALGPLLQSPALAEAVELVLDRGDPGTAQAIAGRSTWPRLARLSLAGNALGEAGVAALAGATCFRALRRLCLGRTELGPTLLAPILAASWLSGLERLELGGNELGDAGAEALANAPALANLRHLDLTGNNLTPKGAFALANSPYLARLETLDLSTSSLGDDGMAALADGTGLPSLTALALRSTGPKAEGLARLARSPLAARLRRLDLTNNKLDGNCLQSLVSSRLGGLKDLRLAWASIGEEGARALASAPFRGLVRLDMLNCKLGDAGMRALLGTHGFPDLAILTLLQAGIGAEGRAALLRWSRLPHLAHLSGAYSYGDGPELLNPSRSATFSERS